MSKPTVMAPAQGSRIVRDGTSTILFGQPPEVLKGLLRHHVESFDTLVLTDVKEKDGSVLNNLEFPFYFFCLLQTVWLRAGNFRWSAAREIFLTH